MVFTKKKNTITCFWAPSRKLPSCTCVVTYGSSNTSIKEVPMEFRTQESAGCSNWTKPCLLGSHTRTHTLSDITGNIQTHISVIALARNATFLK